MTEGLGLYPGYLDAPAQSALLSAIRHALSNAPLYRPSMPGSGKEFSVRMSNCGALGWVSDRTGYRYQDHHPDTKQAWPEMPPALLKLWQDLAGYPHPPEACLINWYEPGARMGLHRDQDEAAREAPVVSISLGGRGLFRIGGPKRRDPTRSVWLSSGDVVILAGSARQCYHGIDRIDPTPASPLVVPGRLNLTLRRVTQPPR